MNYHITTDSTADLPQEFLSERGIACVGMAFQIGGEEYREGPDLSMTSKQFYDRLRAGEAASTMQVNTYEFVDFVEPFLAAGEDVLHIAFSSGLSGTYESCARGAEELREKYPDRKILVVDSLAASMGEGLLVYYADENRKAGMSIDENAKWLEENKLHLCHWFTVDDLMHLHRGGPGVQNFRCLRVLARDQAGATCGQRGPFDLDEQGAGPGCLLKGSCG